MIKNRYFLRVFFLLKKSGKNSSRPNKIIGTSLQNYWGTNKKYL